MSKRKEEEQKIIAEMEQALKENGLETPTQRRERKAEKTTEAPKKKRRGLFSQDDPTPETVHCKRCKTLMEKGVCPTCGYKIYVPMDEAKRKKIRGIVTVVCVAAFILLFVILQLKK